MIACSLDKHLCDVTGAIASIVLERFEINPSRSVLVYVNSRQDFYNREFLASSRVRKFPIMQISPSDADLTNWLHCAAFENFFS